MDDVAIRGETLTTAWAGLGWDLAGSGLAEAWLGSSPHFVNNKYYIIMKQIFLKQH